MDASMVCVRAAFIAVTAIALAACSGGPSESDVRDAMIKQAEASGVRMVAPDYKETIAKVKLVGCEKAERGGFDCDVSTAQGSVANARFVKTDAGWSVAN
ncbi:hypothetical protein NM04_14970 [Massilia aurea]|uniref:Lipoprotein n=1 Tax=Massilia aurea TaxID=373040 RepID=A0A422QJ81_9BURK|nr:hypothetical protein [Massilia aurea]RNF30037.1 hypothetical protein NM04_14970 [Massilia aurea]